jgi:hypothetical protein
MQNTILSNGEELLEKKTLENYFGKKIDENYFQPIIIEVNSKKLNDLKYRLDGGKDEYYMEKGPLDLSLINKIYFEQSFNELKKYK